MMEKSELQAGPRLDALVAENVLGWKRGTGKYHGYWMMPNRGGIIAPIKDIDYAFAGCNGYKPSKNTDEAIQAYDAIKEKWHIEIGYGDVTVAFAGFTEGWYALAWPIDDALADSMKCDDWPIAYSEHGPALAICRVLVEAAEIMEKMEE